MALTRSGRLSQTVTLASLNPTSWSYNPHLAVTRRVWALPRSLATTCGIITYFLLLRVLRCFSSPRSLSYQVRVTGLQPDGLPHSEICGSPRMCRSPQLIAAYRVLHRLRKPRHPPCALTHVQKRPNTEALGRPSLLSFFFIPYVKEHIQRRAINYSRRKASSCRLQPLWYLKAGGPAWTRTTDLDIISVAL